MHLKFDNVNDAFYGIVRGIHNGIIPTRKQASRNGDTLQVEEPLLVTYANPRRRVLFNPARDCNPFFHLYEALWMLAGRNDVAPLAYYNSRMKDYSDDGVTLNGAYGRRWREARRSWTDPDGVRNGTEYDQLEILVQHLNAQPNSRRAVLQMWNVEDDLLKIEALAPCREKGCVNGKWQNAAGRAMLAEGANCPICKGTGKSGKDFSKDVCCNLSVMFSIRSSLNTNGADHQYDVSRGVDKEVRWLDMTITNRSNDLIWGMLGANYVHFTILQEYMAAKLGVEVGVYNHFTNNAHVYLNNWKPEEWLEAHEMAHYRMGDLLPLVHTVSDFDKELHSATEHWGEAWEPTLYSEPFFMMARRVFQLHWQYKHGKAPLVQSDAFWNVDWIIAAKEWLQRRAKS